ncbi:Inhibitor of growth protein 3 [Homalodisca vitripennis]|nr:Inhibitor of growth protein 3 [Homalodisca vitripennis]
MKDSYIRCRKKCMLFGLHLGKEGPTMPDEPSGEGRLSCVARLINCQTYKDMHDSGEGERNNHKCQDGGLAKPEVLRTWRWGGAGVTVCNIRWVMKTSADSPLTNQFFRPDLYSIQTVYLCVELLSEELQHQGAQDEDEAGMVYCNTTPPPPSNRFIVFDGRKLDQISRTCRAVRVTDEINLGTVNTLEKRVENVFSIAKTMKPQEADNEYKLISKDYYKTLEATNEKKQLYMLHLEHVSNKFKMELDAEYGHHRSIGEAISEDKSTTKQRLQKRLHYKLAHMGIAYTKHLKFSSTPQYEGEESNQHHSHHTRSKEVAATKPKEDCSKPYQLHLHLVRFGTEAP